MLPLFVKGTGLFKDSMMSGLVGHLVVVPIGGDSVTGRVVSVTRKWLVLSDPSGPDGESLDGRFIVALPLPWVQEAS